MDPLLLTDRFGAQIKQMRVNRGLTIIGLAHLAGVTRQKLSEIEKGKPTVSLALYAKVLAAMSLEIELVPARRPTFEELREVFR